MISPSMTCSGACEADAGLPAISGERGALSAQAAAQNALQAEKPSGNRKMIAALLLAACFGAGIAMMVMSPEEGAQASNTPKPEPAKITPLPEDKPLSAEEAKRLKGG